MDYTEYRKQQKSLEENSTIINVSETVKKKTTYIEYDDVTLNNDEKTKTVERKVEGKLAEDVRKRVQASPEAVVLITEVEELNWLSELTAENNYDCIIKCEGAVKKFSYYSAQQTFENLLLWLDEDPATPIGGDWD